MAKIGDLLKNLVEKISKLSKFPKNSKKVSDSSQEKSPEKLFSKIKITGMLDSILNLVRSLMARKLLFGIVLSSIVLVVLGIVAAFFLMKPQGKETVVYEGAGNVENLVISIPQGAFPYDKFFRIRVPRQSALESVLKSGSFISQIYELIPSDGKYDMSALPISLRYYLPSELIGSNDSNSISFAAISNDGKTYSIIPGSFIGKDSSGYYVETNLFFLPKWVGVVSTPGQVLKTGIIDLYKTVSAKPTLLIVPGSDPNFSGYFHSARVAGVSIWQSVFGDRSIKMYKYPVNETRSYNYTLLFNQFKSSNPWPSPIIFEAERLAQELKKHPDTEFDILAHEIGGLIVYYCLANHPEIKNIRKVAYVSTPFLGTNIVDPRLALSIYPSKPSVAGKLYNLPDSVISSLQGYLKSSIESVNIYYADLIPNSDFLKKLRFLPYRTDITTVAYMGNSPTMSIDVTSSLLERLYPELVLNLGDGIVSKNSARLPYMTLKVFNGSWNNIYTTDLFIQDIKKYFDYELPELPSYKDDTFGEFVSSEKEKIFERFLTKPELKDFEIDEWKISDNPYIKFVQSLNFPGNQVAIYGGIVYTADENGLYVSGTKVWNETIMNLKETIDGISYGTQTNVYYRKLENFVSYSQDSSDDYLATKNFAIFAKPRPNEKIDFVDETGNLIVTLRGIYGKVIYDGDEIIFMTNREVYRYYYGVKYTAPMGLYRSYDMNYAIVVDDYVLAVTRAYGLLVFDRSGRYIYAGEGWVGNVGLYKVGKYIATVGDNFVTLVDFEKRRMDKIVENIPSLVYDATIWEDKLYIITSDGLLIYKIG